MIRAPSCSVPGSASAVGWNWQSSRSASSAPAAWASTDAGADRAPGVRRPLPQRRAAAGGEHRRRRGDRPAVGDHARRSARRRSTARAPRPPRAPRSGRRRRPARRAAAVIARPVSLPPAWTIRRAEWPPSRPSASPPSGSRVEVDAAARAAPRPPPAPRGSGPRPPPARQRPRPAVSVSAAWRSGESSAASAAASPPWAQKLELSASGLRETSVDPAPRLGRLERDVQAGGAAADARRRRVVALGLWRARAQGAGTVADAVGLYLSPSLLASSTTPAPTPRTRAGCARSRRRSSAAGWPGSSASRRRRRPASSSSASTRPRTSTRSRRFCAARRRDDRHGHGRLEPGSYEAALHAAGGAAAGGRARCSPARPSSRSAGCARRATTPSATGRWASACSTTSPSPPPTRSTRCGAERVLILDWDVHHGNGTEEIFADSADGPLRQHPPVAALSGHRRRRRTPARARARATRSTCRCRRAPARTSSWRSSSTSSCPIARAFEPGLIAISAGYDAHRDDPLAYCLVDEAAYGDMAASDARPGRRARRPGARLPRGRLRPRRARGVGASPRSRRSTAMRSHAGAPGGRRPHRSRCASAARLSAGPTGRAGP